MCVDVIEPQLKLRVLLNVFVSSVIQIHPARHKPASRDIRGRLQTKHEHPDIVCGSSTFSGQEREGGALEGCGRGPGRGGGRGPGGVWEEPWEGA